MRAPLGEGSRWLFLVGRPGLQLNRQRQAKGLVWFANPRNSAAGALKMLDPRQSVARKLRLFAYSITCAAELNLK